MQADIKYTIMNLENLIYVIKNAITVEECESYITEFKRRKVSAVYESSLNAVSGKHEKSTFKVVEIAEQSPNYNNIVKIMNHGLGKWIKYLETFDSFNTEFYRRNLSFPHKIRILEYAEGSAIHPHTDCDLFEHASVVINLNNQYKGGSFCFFNKKICIDLDIGDMLIFPADPFWVHEVTPVTEGCRYSINSFICSRPFSAYQKIPPSTEKPVFTYERNI